HSGTVFESGTWVAQFFSSTFSGARQDCAPTRLHRRGRPFSILTEVLQMNTTTRHLRVGLWLASLGLWSITAPAAPDARDRFFDHMDRAERALQELGAPAEPNLHVYVGGYYDDIDRGLSARGATYEVTFDPSSPWEFAAAGDLYDHIHDSANGDSSGFGDVTLKATRFFGTSDDKVRPTLQARVLL